MVQKVKEAEDAGFALGKIRKGSRAGIGISQRGSQMISHWKWKCEQCGYEFVLTSVHMPAACRRCGADWFLKVGEVSRVAKAE